jgi:hypothetical protein
MPTTVSTELKKTKEYKNIIYMFIVYLMNVICIDLGGCAWVLCLYLCIQIHCKQCQKLIVKKLGDKHHLCSVCDHNRRYPPASETTTTNEIEPLFERIKK